MNIRWWEKTVEYQFIMTVVPVKNLFLAPLDGKEELIGDAIFISKHRWLLIEFKKDHQSINSEIDKFHGRYGEAKEALSSIDEHHYIIYGKKGIAINRVELCYQTYFSGKPSNLETLLRSGKDHVGFAEYVKQFTHFRKGPLGGDGGGSVFINELTFVAGLNSKNEIVECLSLAEFLSAMEMGAAENYATA